MDPGVIHHPGKAVRQGGPEDQHQEDSRNGLLPMPGGRNAVGAGVRDTDDRSRAFLTVEVESLGTVHGVRGVDGYWVAGGLSLDSA